MQANIMPQDFKLLKKKKLTIPPGALNDFSAFGFDFINFVKLRIESSEKIKILLNNNLSYKIDHDIIKSKIIGMDYVFEATGTADYVKLSNKKLVFKDEF
ncbi:MAG: hypothetical protein JST75_19630 [Bacteroidetes bacterium]|nr:hypothetical protein [Bacteroidota bacterium]